MAWDEYFDSAAQGRRPTSDFEWYAVDCKGHVAFLTSAGFGAIPLVVFRDKAKYYQAVEYFRSLPVRCASVLVTQDTSDRSSWTKVASQGIFAYDWDASTGQYVLGRPYQMIAAPEMPLSLSDLPIEVQAWILPTRFDADFGDAMELFPESQFSELHL